MLLVCVVCERVCILSEGVCGGVSRREMPGHCEAVKVEDGEVGCL